MGRKAGRLREKNLVVLTSDAMKKRKEASASGTKSCGQKRTYNETEAVVMKHSRSDVRGKSGLGLDIRFEVQHLTSYSGLILFQHFFSGIGIKERMGACFGTCGGIRSMGVTC